MLRLTHFVLAHRRAVCLFWLVVAVAGAVSVPYVTAQFSKSLNVPGEQSAKVHQQLLSQYQLDSNSPPIVVVIKLAQDSPVRTAKARALLEQVHHKMAQVLPGARILDFASTNNPAFKSADGRTTFAIIYPSLRDRAGLDQGLTEVKELRSALAGIHGAQFYVTGEQALQANGASSSAHGTSAFTETIIGGAAALLVLLFVFSSFIAILPLITAAIAIVTTFLFLGLLTTFSDVSFLVTSIVALIGLGVCIDYVLLIVMRWREECAKGEDNRSAVISAMSTAGHAVIFSGSTVAIGLLALIIVPIDFLRSIGITGLLIPIISVIVCLTLLPALLDWVGPRIDRPRIRRRDREASRGWTWWARLVVKHPWVAAAIALVILIVIALPATRLQLGNPKAESLATKGDAREGLNVLVNSGIGAGTLTPFAVIAPEKNAQRVVSGVKKIRGVRGALIDRAAGLSNGKTAVITVIPSFDANSGQGRSLNTELKRVVNPSGGSVGGQPAQRADFVDAIYNSFPLMIVVIVVLTFILLVRAFRSILLAAKAVLLNLFSLAAAWGVIVWVWQEGHGSQAIWGIQATHAITEFVPLMIFAFLFGLSMDYEVFILTRIREEYDRGASTNQAIVRGLGRTGRLVTYAGLVLFITFAALGAGPETTIKTFATGLAAGIILDATVVRALLVPALVRLFGRWNWWLPEWLAKVLRVQPSPLEKRG